MTENLEECISIIGRCFYEYNYIRPHQALGGVTPYQRFSGFEDELKPVYRFSKSVNCKERKCL
jgi:transposase InsO family protein